LVDFWGLLISKYYHLSKAISFFTAPKNGIIHYYFLALAEVFGLLTLFKLEQYSKAMQNLQDCLDICRRIGARSYEAEVQKNLAILHQRLGERTLALEYCDHALYCHTIRHSASQRMSGIEGKITARGECLAGE
jgi:tetratricopeptide (TPR) repeat protein